MKYICFFALLLSSVANARFASIPIDRAIEKSDAIAIAIVEVVSSKPHYWQSPRGKSVCGHTVEVEVQHLLKGKYGHRLVLASQADLFPGLTLLAFIDSYKGDFPNDVNMKYEDYFKEAKDSCLATLPILKLDPLTTSQVSFDGNIIFPHSLLTFSDELPINKITVSKIELNGNEIDLWDPKVPDAVRMQLPYGEHGSIRYIQKDVLIKYITKD
ncbi:hypothetical protein LZP73_02765 [Shewanella sp. AS16]|uniref:hypothetical protein n=1 Tax=Shewanella sp. AS16 TaxID=2907625 RepID=UPI001F1E61D4|nr:hypothetical protein [Shewanella sp. AS16]MCE9685134.1 hypothetical protein [Shewanella sp. AS16]